MEVTKIPRVELGNQGLKVSKLGLGCVGLSGMLNAPLSFEEGIAVLKEAFARGITYFDTANVYGENHHNEIMIGKALKELPREKVQVSTKFGMYMTEDYQFGSNGKPEYVRECCEASLKRLEVEYIDLYFQHRVDTSVPIEDTMGELKKLVEEGKIKHIGLSDPSLDTLSRAHAVHPVTAVQIEYSLWSRDIEDDLLPLCRKLGIGIVAYSPLGSGFFAGKGTVESMPKESMLTHAGHPRFTAESLDKNKVLFLRLAEIAAKHCCTVPQLALAWLNHQGDDIVPIFGTTKVKNMDSNIGSLAVKLTPEDLKEITEAVKATEVCGDKHMPGLDKFNYKLANTPPKQPTKAFASEPVRVEAAAVSDTKA